MKLITSIQNNYIKNLLKLQEKSRARKAQGLFVVEGEREVSLIKKGGYEIDTLLFLEDFFTEEQVKQRFPVEHKIFINKEVYQKLAYRETTEGIIAVVKTKDLAVEHIKFENQTPLVLVLEGIEKPGNIGAILRTADAGKFDAVFIADAKTDIYNPNIIRSSVGCVFTNQIGVGTSKEIIKFLKAHQIKIYSATLQNSNPYYQEDYTKASAIVVGTEATGLTSIWREQADQNINIPMRGEIDSMNVSVACAIIGFEAIRQRVGEVGI